MGKKKDKKPKEEKKKLWIRNVTFKDEFTLDEFLRKEVNLIVNKYK